MNWILVLGFIAAFFTTICQLPQMIKVIKTKNTSGLSLTTYITLTVGVIFWIAYGFFIKDAPVIISNSLVFTMTAIILIYKLKYK